MSSEAVGNGEGERTTPGRGRSDDTDEELHVEVMLEMYQILHREISQSINFQNQIILGGAVVVGIVYGLQFSGVLQQLQTNDPLVTRLIVASIPPIIIVSTSLWLVEQTRMMRAGDYLSFLETKINDELGDSYLTWELWLRTGNTPQVHRIHDWAQLFGYLGFFYVLGVFGLWLYVREILGTTLVAIAVLDIGNPLSPTFLYFLANIGGFLLLGRFGWAVIGHGVVDEPTDEQLRDIEEFEDFAAAPASYGVYLQWEQAYEQRKQQIADTVKSTDD